MTDWFIWNGRKCTDFGIHVEEHPPITLPAERGEFVTIPGRSGSLAVPEGTDIYDDQVLSCTCFIENTSRVNEIAAWLRGSGTVTFANRQGGFYHARVVNQIPFEKILRGSPYRSFAVSFHCKPFFFLDTEPVTLTSPGSITNPTGFDAFPLVTVEGSGEKATVMISGYSVLIDKPEAPITIDCENMIAYSGDVNAAFKVTLVDDEWPVLSPGVNMINWTGGVSSVCIEPNWRTL